MLLEILHTAVLALEVFIGCSLEGIGLKFVWVNFGEVRYK
ncbi:hypothetical protein COO91_09715 (plasmid) [Nostoc flagelliforme CCNUN1]|uniref:Uncharacterized protein n=1 Tax=Nostoc flagelliforme CCNUN1 TaxID=2038116 RepID=A0A2K8T768_9NOSO|nr:hypothetical protein COO91_09715 [Nostoc flagelliforme CCNUN1]